MSAAICEDPSAVAAPSGRAPRAFAASDSGKTIDMLIFERNTYRKKFKEEFESAKRYYDAFLASMGREAASLSLLVKWATADKKEEAKEMYMTHIVASPFFVRTVSTEYTTKEVCSKEARGKKSRDAWVKPGEPLKDGSVPMVWVAWVQSEDEPAPFYDKAVKVCREWFEIDDDGEIILKKN
jgi:hypothetical protein